MIAVCGANGTIGKRVVDALRRQHANFRALVRATATSSASSQPDLWAVDLSDRKSVVEALQGVESVWLLTPIGPTQTEMELNVVRAAVDTHVKRIVKLSVMGAGSGSLIEFAKVHRRLEEAIQESPCEWTFLRSNMFMQNLFWYKEALQQGSLPLPLGQASVSHVDGDDLAAVAAKILLGSSYSGQAYTITGPEALTGTGAASILSEVLGREIAYRPISSADFRAYLKSTNESDYVVEAEVELFKYWSEGHGSEVSEAVPLITNRRATTLREFAERERHNLI